MQSKAYPILPWVITMIVGVALFPIAGWLPRGSTRTRLFFVAFALTLTGGLGAAILSPRFESLLLWLVLLLNLPWYWGIVRAWRRERRMGTILIDLTEKRAQRILQTITSVQVREHGLVFGHHGSAISTFTVIRWEDIASYGWTEPQEWTASDEGKIAGVFNLVNESANRQTVLRLVVREKPAFSFLRESEHVVAIALALDARPAVETILQERVGSRERPPETR